MLDILSQGSPHGSNNQSKKLADTPRENLSNRSNNSLILSSNQPLSSRDIRDSIEVSRSLNINSDKLYTKTNEKISSTSDPHILKHASKISNHRYLACLSLRPENRLIIESSLKKYSEPIFPLTLGSRSAESMSSTKKVTKSNIPNCPKLPDLNKSTLNS